MKFTLFSSYQAAAVPTAGSAQGAVLLLLKVPQPGSLNEIFHSG